MYNYTHFSTTNHIAASAHEQCCHLVNNYNNAYFTSFTYKCEQVEPVLINVSVSCHNLVNVISDHIILFRIRLDNSAKVTAVKVKF